MFLLAILMNFQVNYNNDHDRITGSHTGAIQAYGGMADPSAGGGGSGGRIALYQSSHHTIPPYRGVYNVQGGQGNPATGAEPGASGTVYIEDPITGASSLLVDNNGRKQRAEKSEIPNEGRRLDLGIDEAGYHRGSSFMSRAGHTIQSSAATYVSIPILNSYCENYDSSSHVLMNLFDQTLAPEKHQYYTANTGSATITIRLANNITFVNHLKIYPESRFPTRFKVLD